MATKVIITSKKLEGEARPLECVDEGGVFNVFAGEDVSIPDGHFQKVKTGISVGIPKGYVAKVYSVMPDGKLDVSKCLLEIKHGNVNELIVPVFNPSVFWKKDVKTGDLIARLIVTSEEISFAGDFEECEPDEDDASKAPDAEASRKSLELLKQWGSKAG